MLEVTRAEYTGGHCLRLCFSNGDEGTVDLSDSLWGPMFESLKDEAAFRRFEVSPVLHTICWDNDADLAPEYLHEKMVEQSPAREAAAASGVMAESKAPPA
jgi:hypothetical protein